MRKLLLLAITVGAENALFPALPLTVQDSRSPQCRADSAVYAQNLENHTLWAFEMWDATAKSASGILRGNIFQLGHFEQCITTEAPFLTQYCLPTIEAVFAEERRQRDPLSLHHQAQEHILDRIYPYKDASQQVRNVIQMGWCIPASCPLEDMQEYLTSYINQSFTAFREENVSYTVKVPKITCSTRDEFITIGVDDVFFCVLFAVFFLFVVASTVFDFASREADEKKVKEKSKDEGDSSLFRYLVAFSARKNFNDLNKKDETNKELASLYGIRTICIFFIIVDHRFGTFTSSAIMNFNYIEQQYRAPLAPFLFHGDLFVDTFFILAGILVTFSLLNHLKKRKLNPAFVILMRYIRLTPAYAFVIFYYATIYKYTGTGPFWKVIAGQESQDCQENWWTNLLYINNYVNPEHLCMAHSWYLPCDFHYFILAIGVCLLINKSARIGLYSLILLGIISLLIPFCLTIIYQRPALLHFYPDFLTAPKVHPDYLLTYTKSHTRASSYLVGIGLGYIYHKQQGSDFHIGKVKSYLIWATSIALMLVSIFGGAVFYNPYHKYNPLEAAFYAALHRPAFDVGTAGVIFVCSFGHGAFVRKILSWSPWIPLSKLVYCAYLVHMQFQLRYASIFKAPYYFSYFDVINLALADILLSFIVGLGLYLMVEAPFKNIFREVFRPNRIHPPKETNVQENGSSDSRL